MAKKTKKGAPEHVPGLAFGRESVILGASGVVCLALGYWLLAQGSITAAPLLLVLAYAVLLPLAIIR